MINVVPIRYINSDSGDDITGDGTHKNPFKTLERALSSAADRFTIVRWDSALIHCPN